TEAAFHGRMRAFADEVRAAGLGFGLWMEPERFGPQAPIRTAHPEWFIMSGSAARIDLTQPAAYTYQRSEIARLVETYDLAWMKIDFNFVLDADASGAELHDYTAAWYRLLDDIRSSYPHTFFEGCSSGAMRGDLATLSHFDGHFLSDTVNPIDVLRITQGAWLRLPPGRLARWAVLRSAGHAAPRYGQSQTESPHVIIAPHGAVWEPSETVDLTFAVLAAMPGMLGFSGDFASLPPDALAAVREHVAFFKKWREFITGADGHLLTPPEPIGARTGWVGFQLCNPAHAASLVFAYRLGVAAQSQRWLLHDLNPATAYSVRRGIGAGASRVFSGEQLMRDGLSIDIPPAGGWRSNAGAVYVIEPQG
ncbi:MAG: alpha-galactosidase, partial [Chloroflexi bacterium]|nr:alpha-galactosidase [Chloroflexota bacterium]